jgi:hypothetical protein
VPYKDPAVRRAKQKEYSAKHYQKNTEQIKAAVKAGKKRNADWWREYKAGFGCMACEENDPDCIDFHHVISDGKANRFDSAYSWVHSKDWAPARIKDEIERTCVPLCASCHRKVHAQHKRWLKEEQNAGK